MAHRTYSALLGSIRALRNRFHNLSPVRLKIAQLGGYGAVRILLVAQVRILVRITQAKYSAD